MKERTMSIKTIHDNATIAHEAAITMLAAVKRTCEEIQKHEDGPLCARHSDMWSQAKYMVEFTLDVVVEYGDIL